MCECALGLRPTHVIILLALLAATGSPAPAQTGPDSTRTDTLDARNRLEPLLDSFTAVEQSSEQVSEQYASLLDDPFDLNRASASELASIPGLSVSAAHRIVQHRTENGPFQSRQHLESVTGISAELIQTIRPFVTVAQQNRDGSGGEPFPSLKTIVSGLETDVIQRFTRRLDLGRGYREDRFLGSPARLTTRVRVQFERRLELALTVDKDPGEAVTWAPSTNTYGFDHVAGSAAVHDLGPVETLVVGNFTAQFGQGVGLWQGIRFSKGRNPVGPVVSSGRGLRPYSSASEANYFRGAGATVELSRNVYVTAFGSHRHRDATIDSSLALVDGPSSKIPARTVSGGGRHRTQNEIERKGTFGETLVGGAAEYRTPTVRAGIAGYTSRFDRPLRPGDKPYRRFRVSGRRTSMLSTYASAYLRDYVIFGEIARAPTGSYGGLLGASLDASRRAQAVVVGRYYPPDFPNFHGNAFGESSSTQNETGVYTGLQLQVAPDWRVRAYLDQYQFPWLRFNVGRPSSGWEARAVVEYEPRPWLTTYVQLRSSTEEAGVEVRNYGTRLLEGLGSEHRRSVRLHAEYDYSRSFTLRTRLEAAQHRGESGTSNGLFLSQGLHYEPFDSFELDARIALFDTDGYEARIYAYERDLLYSFSVPVFFDRGQRSYVLAEYAPTSSITIEAKYGVTRYDNRSTIGSGLNQIDGSKRRDVGFQVRWEF